MPSGDPAKILEYRRSIFGISEKTGGEPFTEQYLHRHKMLTQPEEWFLDNRNKWEQCFLGKRSDKVTIGCVDPRVAHSAQLRYAGLGVVDGSLERAAEKIIRLREGVLSDCAITLESHDLCTAIRAMVSRHPRAGEVDCDAFAQWWGAELAQLINDLSPGIPVRHQHLFRSGMQELRPIEALYVDCTDAFNPTSDVPYGHTISLLNPGGIRFGTSVRLRNLLGNGLDAYLMPQVEFIIEQILKMTPERSKENPLTLVVVRDRMKRFLSNVAQKMAEDLAERHGQKVRMMGVDQRGTIHTLEKYDQNEGKA